MIEITEFSFDRGKFEWRLNRDGEVIEGKDIYKFFGDTLHVTDDMDSSDFSEKERDALFEALENKLKL